MWYKCSSRQASHPLFVVPGCIIDVQQITARVINPKSSSRGFRASNSKFTFAEHGLEVISVQNACELNALSWDFTDLYFEEIFKKINN